MSCFVPRKAPRVPVREAVALRLSFKRLCVFETASFPEERTVLASDPEPVFDYQHSRLHFHREVENLESLSGNPGDFVAFPVKQ